MEVKKRRKTSGLGDSFFPATVCDLGDASTCGVGVVFAGETARHEVSLDRICAADAEPFQPETTLEPRAAVEAFFEGAWCKGEVVRHVENTDRYLVKVGSKKRMAMAELEEMGLKELRQPRIKVKFTIVVRCYYFVILYVLVS